MMRKIELAGDKEEKEKRKKMWLTIIMVGIMALSTAGFALNFASTETKKYNGFKFERSDSGWTTGSLPVATTYLPSDVENISSSGSFQSSDFSAKAYIILGQSIRAPAVELISALPLKNSQMACLPEQENDSDCSDLPLKSCYDADSQNAVIIFKESNETSLSYRGYCLQIQGDEEGLLKAADKAVFMAYGIIK